MLGFGESTLVKSMYSSASDMALKIWKLFGNINFLSPSRPMNEKKELWILVLVPVSTFGFVCLSTWISGVIYQPGCNSVSNFIGNLFFQPTPPSTCRGVPFLSDVPTLILSFTCPFALVAYQTLRRRLASLLQKLESTGLLSSPQDSTDKISRGIRRLERAIDLTPPIRIAVFAASVGMVTWLYSRNLVGGDLFNTLANTSADGTSNVEELRATWWANYHHHPWLAGLAILIGSVGVTYALRAGWLYIRLGAVLYSTRSSQPADLPVRYVPRWKDRSYGWSPVTGVLMLLYMSTISFGISMVAVFDMLRNERWTVGVAIFFAILGIASNTVIILTSFFRMINAHGAVEDGLRKTLAKESAQRSPGMTSEEYVIAGLELTVWRRIPVASFVGSAIKILPGIYALVQLVRMVVA